jgi:cation transport ATPase
VTLSASLRLSRLTFRTIKQNLFCAVSCNMAAIPRFLLLLAADAQVMRGRCDHLMPTPQARPQVAATTHDRRQ